MFYSILCLVASTQERQTAAAPELTLMMTMVAAAQVKVHLLQHQTRKTANTVTVVTVNSLDMDRYDSHSRHDTYVNVNFVFSFLYF